VPTFFAFISTTVVSPGSRPGADRAVPLPVMTCNRSGHRSITSLNTERGTCWAVQGRRVSNRAVSKVW